MAVDDIYTKFLSHMDGADGSTTFIDEAGNTITANGGAQIDTAQYVFGGAAGLFNGTTSYLSIPDSNDWRLDGGSNSNAWTIDLRVRFASLASNNGFCGQKVDNDNLWRFLLNNNTGGIQFRQRYLGSNTIDMTFTWSPSINTWYHIELDKIGTTGYKCFVNGNQIGSTVIDTTPMRNFATTLEIGRIDGSYMNGWQDEVRISKGIARNTSNFTPPSSPYAPPTATGNFFALF